VDAGFGEDRDAFTSRMHLGPHLLAPTGSDLAQYNEEGTIFAGWHTDLNLLTIHGKSNFPGLSIWTREGSKMSVKVPDGCLLVQAGKQIEYLTGAQRSITHLNLSPKTLLCSVRLKHARTRTQLVPAYVCCDDQGVTSLQATTKWSTPSSARRLQLRPLLLASPRGGATQLSFNCFRYASADFANTHLGRP
jgi:hypothetical protein